METLIQLEILTQFLDSVFKKLNEFEIDVNDLQLDHIAYQADSSQNYEELTPEFMKLGEKVRELIISDRRIGVFRLHSPIIYSHYSIEALELIEPVLDEKVEQGWQHAEFVIHESFESFIAKYPDVPWDTKNIDRPQHARLKLKLDSQLEVKFHLQSILED